MLGVWHGYKPNRLAAGLGMLFQGKHRPCGRGPGGVVTIILLRAPSSAIITPYKSRLDAI